MINGEAVSKNWATKMEWVPYEPDGLERLNVNTFLGLWRAGPEQEYDRIAFCCQSDDGSTYALAETAGDDEPMAPKWIEAEPDEILVPMPAARG